MKISKIIIKGAAGNNLKSVDVEIPHDCMTVITGVSGSGKSSLAFDILFHEGQRRYLETFSSHTRQYLGKMMRPEVEHISGLRPAISVSQKTTVKNPRSTVGTLTEMHDLLRLLFARKGASDDKQLEIDRSLFSFNTQKGACHECKGLGVKDRIAPRLFITSPEKTLRGGAMSLTTPNGYIIYSQVTMDVLNQVCNAEGFSVDIPWNQLTGEQKHIVLYGSDKIKIPFGKHTLESRMKWTGITAKPRDEGYYKGMIPVMEEILKRDRNVNILKYAETVTCEYCGGKRHSTEALSVIFDGRNIADFSAMTVKELYDYFSTLSEKSTDDVIRAVSVRIAKITGLLSEAGLGYITPARESSSLSGGEAQRIRLVNQVISELQGVLYILDEPSIGLHEQDTEKLLRIIRQLVNNGNTVVVVEHDEHIILAADHIIDIGPLGGYKGGEIMYSGPLKNFLSSHVPGSLTHAYITGKKKIPVKKPPDKPGEELRLVNANRNNLKNINAAFKPGQFNVVTGVSGAGKSSLIEELLETSIAGKINGGEQFGKVIHIDQSPIGRTPRSNPATYTKVFDQIRDLYAGVEASKQRGWKKNRFSFNVAGGRCESCQGAGYQHTGMHFLGDVDIICEDCHGKRFTDETLEVLFRDKSIFDILEMEIDEACDFFKDIEPVARILAPLKKLGLGYIRLGQPATTLSGGEAQRVKLAAELARPTAKSTLYILDEPTTGLHFYDTEILIGSLHELAGMGNTVICIEHHPDFILNAGHVVDLGPGSGEDGGQIVYQGNVTGLINCPESVTGKALAKRFSVKQGQQGVKQEIIKAGDQPLLFKNVRTNNLKNIDIDIPRNKITVLTGVSGSGKSSFGFDTLFAEGQNRFTENLSAYVRTKIAGKRTGNFDLCRGITPAIAISQNAVTPHPRSTVGTITEIYDYYRLLLARCNDQGETLLSTKFSFNHKDGACPACNGLGVITTADPEKFITHPECSLLNGALDGTKTGKFYGDPYGQFTNLLIAVGNKLGMDFGKPYNELSNDERETAIYGAGDRIFKAEWRYKRKNRDGVHAFSKKWEGFAALINEEYQRKHADNRGESMMDVMADITCPDCRGSRLSKTALGYTFRQLSMNDLTALSIEAAITFFGKKEDKNELAKPVLDEIVKRLTVLNKLGLGYLSTGRSSDSLSGGESQRLRLSSLLSGELTGITYILDEPTIGLHPTEIARLKEVINKLNELGNTVVIIEHDQEIIRMADHIIEFGPGAGRNGGHIVFKGTYGELMKQPGSLTAEWMAKPLPAVKQATTADDHIYIKNARANNLKNISLSFPLKMMSVVTGVSGAGKSSLLFDVLNATAVAGKPVNCDAIEGLEQFSNIIDLRQRNMHGSLSGNTLTYNGLFEHLRDIFASLEAAKKAGYKKAHFSFNRPGGRCEHCKGTGRIRISMDFMPDIHEECEVCHGRQFQPGILDCRINEKNIHEVLQMTVDELAEFHGKIPGYHKKFAGGLSLLQDTGLGYLVCGQATSTLSGGEAQRLQLVRELIKTPKGSRLYLFDEPTTGLHPADTSKLLTVFDRLLAEGHTIILTEHDRQITGHAGYVIQLGPGGGENGGRLT